MATKLGDHPPSSPEWHALRAGRLGGSDAGTLIGHGFRDWRELLAEKAGGTEPTPDTPAMARGRWLEPALLAYAADRGYVADPAMHGTYVDDERNWMLANPDGIAGSVLIEAKSTSWRDPEKWGRGGSDQIPPGFLAQVTWNCHVLGLERWVLPVVSAKLTPGAQHSPCALEFSLYKGHYNPEFAAFLIRRGERFMQELQETK